MAVTAVIPDSCVSCQFGKLLGPADGYDPELGCYRCDLLGIDGTRARQIELAQVRLMAPVIGVVYANHPICCADDWSNNDREQPNDHHAGDCRSPG